MTGAFMGQPRGTEERRTTHRRSNVPLVTLGLLAQANTNVRLCATHMKAGAFPGVVRFWGFLISVLAHIDGGICKRGSCVLCMSCGNSYRPP